MCLKCAFNISTFDVFLLFVYLGKFQKLFLKSYCKQLFININLVILFIFYYYAFFGHFVNIT